MAPEWLIKQEFDIEISEKSELTWWFYKVEKKFIIFIYKFHCAQVPMMNIKLLYVDVTVYRFKLES